MNGSFVLLFLYKQTRKCDVSFRKSIGRRCRLKRRSVRHDELKNSSSDTVHLELLSWHKVQHVPIGCLVCMESSSISFSKTVI